MVRRGTKFMQSYSRTASGATIAWNKKAPQEHLRDHSMPEASGPYSC